MEFKGTKGDWILNNFVIESETGWDIAEVWNANDEENKANALLISKSKQMLEMLIKCEDAISELQDYQEGWEQDLEDLRNLIKEATELK